MKSNLLRATSRVPIEIIGPEDLYEERAMKPHTDDGGKQNCTHTSK